MEYPKTRSPEKLVRLRIKRKSLKLAVYENDNTVDIYIGGPTIYCMHAFVNKPTSVFVEHGISALSTGTIANILHNIECSLEHNFQKGMDTTAIVYLLMAYITNHYPYVQTLSFTDASHKTCDNGHIVELSEMTYIRTGITWYQKHFRAYLTEKDQSRFLEANARFQALKRVFTWAHMKSIMTTYDGTIMEEDAIKSLFETAATWQDFFGPLSDKIGISVFCAFVAPWLHTFLIQSLRFNFSGPMYVMPLTVAVDYEEAPLMQGGKRFTQKRLKQRPLSMME
jgi:hypothetical protein